MGLTALGYVIYGVLTLLFSAVVTLVTLKFTIKKAKGEADSIEIKNESEIIANYKTLLKETAEHYNTTADRQNETIAQNEKDIASLRKEVAQLHKKLNQVMEENNRLNLFVNEAFKCEHDFRNCPVIKLKQEMSKRILEKEDEAED